MFPPVSSLKEDIFQLNLWMKVKSSGFVSVLSQRIKYDSIINLSVKPNPLQFKMDASMKKAFQVKVRSLGRILKEYKNYRTEVQGYDLNEVSQDKKKQEFYLESKSALDEVEKKLLDYYQQLRAYVLENKEAIEGEEEAAVKADLEAANTQILEVQNLLPAAC